MLRRGFILSAAALFAGACSAEAPKEVIVKADAPDGPPGGRPNPSALFEHTNRTVPTGREFGWAVIDLKTGGLAGQNPDQPYPQHSVFKLWLAAMVLDRVDRGEMKLDERILVTRADLGFPYQPIAEKVGPQGYSATVEELVRYIVIQSDNPSADVLLRRVGGPAALTAWLRSKGVEDIQVDRSERELHAEAAEMRRRVAAAPAEGRLSVIHGYLFGGRDAATPAAAATALAKLHRGELLSPASTRMLLSIMTETVTGPNRLRAGIEPGWKIGHKTGSGGMIDGRSKGSNDIGLLTAPDGRTYAVAVFTAGDDLTPEKREAIAADVARGVVAQWKKETGAG